jgi:hypothetical protein
MAHRKVTPPTQGLSVLLAANEHRLNQKSMLNGKLRLLYLIV